MVQVIVQPAAGSVAQSHYSDTIEAPVPLTRIFPFLADDQAEMLTVLYPDGHAPVWGGDASK
jgi:hypothetical protein